mmetsp:Transcript_51761/g.171518  ORF Transcript_51761/g.171518 Transcript_51761/m.171518 type:complete len:268 (-) Transcript_51761:207-1010(-)
MACGSPACPTHTCLRRRRRPRRAAARRRAARPRFCLAPTEPGAIAQGARAQCGSLFPRARPRWSASRGSARRRRCSTRCCCLAHSRSCSASCAARSGHTSSEWSVCPRATRLPAPRPSTPPPASTASCSPTPPGWCVSARWSRTRESRGRQSTTRTGPSPRCCSRARPTEWSSCRPTGRSPSRCLCASSVSTRRFLPRSSPRWRGRRSTSRRRGGRRGRRRRAGARRTRCVCSTRSRGRRRRRTPCARTSGSCACACCRCETRRRVL